MTLIVERLAAASCVGVIVLASFGHAQAGEDYVAVTSDTNLNIVVLKHASLHEAAFSGDVEDAIKHLDLGAEVNATDADSVKSTRWAQLTSHWAAKTGPTAVAQLWDAMTARAASLGTTGDRPLHRAAECGSVQMIELLLDRGADLAARNERGWTALHYAALAGNTDAVKTLLAHGADANARDNEENTPLHMAAEQGHVAVARLLLMFQANVNAQDRHGITPLHWATYSADYDMAKLLLAKGARINARDNDGMTPKRWAAVHLLRSRGHGDLVNSLILHGGIE